MNLPLYKLMAQVVAHLPDDGDRSLIVLKGHLILEEELNRILAAAVSSPEHVAKARLRFSQLAEITKAHYFTQEQSWLWGAISKLNDIRNDYAHSLEPEKVDDKVHGFVQLVESKLGRSEENFEERLRRCIALVIAALHDHRARNS